MDFYVQIILFHLFADNENANEEQPTMVHAYVSRPDHWTFMKWSKPCDSITKAFGDTGWELTNDTINFPTIVRLACSGFECWELLAYQNSYEGEDAITVTYRNIVSGSANPTINDQLWYTKIYKDCRSWSCKENMQLNAFQLCDLEDYDRADEQISPRAAPMWSIDQHSTVMSQFWAMWNKAQLENEDNDLAAFQYAWARYYMPYEAELGEHKLF